ncbi:taste receptor type 2 member 134-like [Ambystoma mexicanum]|uniref:taste receptor type 2 member 134-like n=1 Tax=Ambystoma mexicanum TaxID=8296 RepID=UPI0037E77292
MTLGATATVLLAASSLLLCSCLVGNLFILKAILHQRPASPRALPTNELVISCLAVVNVLNGLANFIWMVVYLLGLCQRAGGWVYQVVDFACMSTASTGFWFTACLSAFYSLKISSFSPPCFARLRLRAPSAMPYVLLFLLLACGALSGPTISYISLKEANGSDLHCGDYYELSAGYNAYIMSFTILAYVLPLAALTICSFLLVASLCRHSRRMQGRLGGPRAGVHLRVAKMVLGLLAFYTACVVLVQLSDQLYMASGGNSDWFITYSFVMLAYSAGCPLALTWGTVRLHQRLMELCSCRGCCSAPARQRKPEIDTGCTSVKCGSRSSTSVAKSIFMMAVE